MEIRGIGFVGSHTEAHEEMCTFLRDVLGLRPMTVDGVGATLFAPRTATSSPWPAPTRRTGSPSARSGSSSTIVDAAAAELHAAGVETDGINENAHWRYTHFRMPDGKLYELVEEPRREAGAAPPGSTRSCTAARPAAHGVLAEERSTWSSSGARSACGITAQ